MKIPVLESYSDLPGDNELIDLEWWTQNVCGLTQQVVVGILLILEGQTTIADMIQVLEPLKVRHSHTTSVHKQVLELQGKH